MARIDLFNLHQVFVSLDMHLSNISILDQRTSSPSPFETTTVANNKGNDHLKRIRLFIVVNLGSSVSFLRGWQSDQQGNSSLSRPERYPNGHFFYLDSVSTNQLRS